MSERKLRRIAPLLLPDIKAAEVTGAKPKLRWVKPTDLLVDETYQRDLSRKSLQLIRGMVEGFAWNRMKPPIVVEVADGLHVLDGQHTAIAAATLGLDGIPIFIVEAASVAARARAFVGHNTDRIVVAPINIHQALLGAGDEAATDVDNVCRRAGVRIRWINQGAVVAEGDTQVVGGIYRLVKRRGVRKAREVLECLVKAKRRPISAGEIMACEELLCVRMPKLDPAVLTAVIRVEGDAGLNKARGTAKERRTPAWREIMARYVNRIEKA